MPNLTQLGSQRIEIIVKKDGGSFSQTNAKEKETDNIGGENEEYSFWLGTANRDRKKRVIKTNTTHGLAVLKQGIDLGLEYYVAGLGYKTGDQAYQEQISRQVEIMKDVTGFASSVGMGALYGSWGGPIGAVLGATFGAVQTAVSTGVKYMGRKRDFSYKEFKENNAIEYQRARASINMTTGRLR